jgi:hypothetical protein
MQRVGAIDGDPRLEIALAVGLRFVISKLMFHF